MLGERHKPPDRSKSLPTGLDGENPPITSVKVALHRRFGSIYASLAALQSLRLTQDNMSTRPDERGVLDDARFPNPSISHQQPQAWT
jgi:hypothetical protein